MSDLSEKIDTGDVVKTLSDGESVSYFMVACVVDGLVYSTGDPMITHPLDKCTLFGKSGLEYRNDKLYEMLDYPVGDIRREYAAKQLCPDADNSGRGCGESGLNHLLSKEYLEELERYSIRNPDGQLITPDRGHSHGPHDSNKPLHFRSHFDGEFIGKLNYPFEVSISDIVQDNYPVHVDSDTKNMLDAIRLTELDSSNRNGLDDRNPLSNGLYKLKERRNLLISDLKIVDRLINIYGESR